MTNYRARVGWCRRRSSKTVEFDRSRRAILVAGAALAAAAFSRTAFGQFGLSIERNGTVFTRVRTQFIAALASPDAQAGRNAQHWGLWRHDPGPRGVQLSEFDRLLAARGVAPARWQFDGADWWLEEHGLIMEQPEFPLPPGQYLVTGNREVTTVLTVGEPKPDGSQPWALADGATIYDVTHLRCRSARYTPAADAGRCTPSRARERDFPVEPGAEMPPVDGCRKQDYAVLFVIGLAARDG